MGSGSTRDSRADDHWEGFARSDPYWAVLTDERFRGRAMSPSERDEFFARGERHVRGVMATRDALLGNRAPPRRALDFGCGVGRLLPALARRCHEVVGVDISAAMVEEARLNCRRMAISSVELVRDSDGLQAVGGSFDFVHSVLVFQHIEPRRGERILASLCDKLAPGGVAALQFTVGSRRTRLQDGIERLRSVAPPIHLLLNVLSGRAAARR